MREDRLVPAKHEGHWGFWSPQGLFYPLDDAVQVALGGETAWGQAVYQWWDVVLRILSRGQFGPAVDVVGDQVLPRWRVRGIDWVRTELDLTADEDWRWAEAFLSDTVDDFIRRHAPDLEVRRAIGGPLGRRLMARLLRPRALWDLNPGDRAQLLAAMAEWQEGAPESERRERRRVDVVQRPELAGIQLTVHGVSRPELAEWSLAFPPYRQLLGDSGGSGLLLQGAEADAFWDQEIHRLNGLGVAIHWPERWQNPRLRLSGRVDGGPSESERFLGLNQLVSVDWTIALGDHTLHPSDLAAVLASGKPYVRVGSYYLVVDAETVAHMRRVLDQARHRRIKTADALRWVMAGDDGEPALNAEGQLAEWVARLRAPLPPFEPLPGFQGALRSYQQEGVEWLARRMELGVGALLADDMGLGKTVEVIAALARIRQRGLWRGPVLIVAPLSVVGNWEREIRRFYPALSVGVHVGIHRALGEAFLGWRRPFDIILTTYDVLLRDVEAIRQVVWEGVVADEAQQLKNPRTKRARAIRELDAHWRVALTGTPVENRLGDLWAEMEFLNPGYLGPFRDFSLRFERQPEALATLRRLMAPFLLRRVKTDPAVMPDLPQKIESKDFTHLTPEQATLYQAVLDRLWHDVQQSTDRMARRGAIVAALTHLKQVVDHPALFLKNGGPLKDRSGKLARVEELLTEILAAGERVVIFTQYVSWATLLEPYLRRKFHVPVALFHGSLSKEERDRVLHQFEAWDGPPIFLASLKAGGVGLNLSQAQHVIHYDRWWNPAVEDQATDRVWRLGQTAMVTVHKFVTRGTIEERIDAMIEHKRALSHEVLQSGGVESWLTELGDEELRRWLELEETAWVDQ
ncbi:SNF2-related protein [Sulfobacillus acidophilus DSM 10332]|uniref:SNF2-related protein n=1 Tax=Sulfobacillus acidophilus (strain ATCC 700253 / DSM 10332 / NAL) TaxID=679936 RepID=G8TUW1_SULAD|nr:SNF2-related protein [Sulfobacillus acidophilus DSM 10332]